MKVTRIYPRDNGQSHFEDTEYQLTEPKDGQLLAPISAGAMMLRETRADYHYDFRTAPWRQFVINMDAVGELEVRDGAKCIIGPEKMVLVEDTTGQGHISRSVNGKARRSLYVTLN